MVLSHNPDAVSDNLAGKTIAIAGVVVAGVGDIVNSRSTQGGK
jgi:hypothetical protein